MSLSTRATELCYMVCDAFSEPFGQILTWQIYSGEAILTPQLIFPMTSVYTRRKSSWPLRPHLYRGQEHQHSTLLDTRLVAQLPQPLQRITPIYCAQ